MGFATPNAEPERTLHEGPINCETFQNFKDSKLTFPGNIREKQCAIGILQFQNKKETIALSDVTSNSDHFSTRYATQGDVVCITSIPYSVT